MFNAFIRIFNCYANIFNIFGVHELLDDFLTDPFESHPPPLPDLALGAELVGDLGGRCSPSPLAPPRSGGKSFTAGDI